MAAKSERARPALLDVILENTIRNPLRLVGGIVLLLILFVALRNVLTGEYEFDQFLRQLINGLGQGSIYALIALGYTLVYGILRMINFAHGEIFMSGAYFGFFSIYFLYGDDRGNFTGLLRDQPILALLFVSLTSIGAAVLMAVLLERIAYRPLRNAPRLVPLITAIGASFTIQYAFARLFGSDPRTYPTMNLYVLPQLFPLECEAVNGVEVCRGLDLISGGYRVTLLGAEVFFRPIHLVVFLLSIALMIGLWFFVTRTKTGKAMRAVSEDKKTAALMGINVDRVIVITFVLGAILAGAAAVPYALYYNRQITPFIGLTPGIKAFTAAVLGGIGNIPGAMFGGLFLGVIESIGPSLLDIPAQLEDVIAFGLLVLILIFRPSGIFGEVTARRV